MHNDNIPLGGDAFNQSGGGGGPADGSEGSEREKEKEPDTSDSGKDWKHCLEFLDWMPNVTWQDLVRLVPWKSKKSPNTASWYKSRTARKAFAWHHQCQIPKVLLYL